MNKCQDTTCRNYDKYCRIPGHTPEEIKPAVGIKKVSDKTDQILKKKYMPLARLYIKNHPVCEAKLECCEGVSACIHHKAGRIGELLIDVGNFLAVCFTCHRQIEENPVMAKEKGLSESRLTNA